MRRPAAPRSPRLARSALLAAALFAVIALLLGGLRFTVLDNHRFSDAVASSLSKPAVDRFVGERTAAALVNARPGLQGVEPLLSSAISAVARTTPVRALARVAAGQFHKIVIGGDRNAGALVLANMAVFVTQALTALRPELAGHVPNNLAVQLVSLESGGAGAAINDIAHLAEQLGTAMWVAIGLALALAAVALALAEDRPRTVQRAGFALAAAALLAAGLFALAIVLLPVGLSGAGAREAAGALLASVLGPAVRLNIGIALAAAIAGVCARSVIEEQRLDLLARGLVGAAWRGSATRALLGLIAGALGLGLLIDPRAVGLAALAVVGAALMLFGLELLARSLIELGGEGRLDPREAIAAARTHLDLRRVARAGALALLLLLAVGLWTRQATLAPAAPTDQCNGLKALCARRLDQVIFPATHNSFSAAQQGFLFANQRSGIDAQLAGGIRGLLIDTHPGVKTPKGVYTVLPEDEKSRSKLDETIGPQATATAETVRAQIGYRGGGSPQVYLCHAFCEIGATLALTQFTSIREFLVTHPEAVLVISVEDDASPQSFAEVVKQSGLLDLVWQGPVEPLPTLGQMVEAGQRVLFMVEVNPGDVPWLHKQFEITQETPYDFKSSDELLGPEGCKPNRGPSTAPLFLINDFIEASTPSTKTAASLNEPATLVAHARTCASERHRVPTLLAVDQWQIGNVVEAARELNEQPPATGPEG